MQSRGLLLVSAALAFFATALQALHAAEPGPKAGFRKFRWGDEPAHAMRPLDTKAGMEVFYLPGDSDRVGGVDKAMISYLFYQGRLCRVEVRWRKLLDHTELYGLTATLSNTWGPADEAPKLDPAIPFYKWFAADKRTEAILSGIDSIKTPEPDYLMTLIIQEQACSAEAINGPGL